MKPVLWLVAGLAALAWFTLGASASWVRPVALAVLAGALALAYWRRTPARPDGGSKPGDVGEKPGDVGDGREAAAQSTKDVWDALDRGEDPTSAPAQGSAEGSSPGRGSDPGREQPQ